MKPEADFPFKRLSSTEDQYAAEFRIRNCQFLKPSSYLSASKHVIYMGGGMYQYEKIVNNFPSYFVSLGKGAPPTLWRNHLSSYSFAQEDSEAIIWRIFVADCSSWRCWPVIQDRRAIFLAKAPSVPEHKQPAWIIIACAYFVHSRILRQPFLTLFLSDNDIGLLSWLSWHIWHLSYFTLTYFEAWNFYTQKYVNSQQNCVK